MGGLLPALFGPLALRSSATHLQPIPIRSLYYRDEDPRRVWQQALTFVNTSFWWIVWRPPSLALLALDHLPYVYSMLHFVPYTIETNIRSVFGGKLSPSSTRHLGGRLWCPPSLVLCPYKNTLHIHRLFDSDLYVIETECSGMFGTKVGCPRRHVVLVGTNPVRFSWSCITLCTSTACYTRISML